MDREKEIVKKRAVLVYATAVKLGAMRIDNVPEQYRDDVRKILAGG